MLGKRKVRTTLRPDVEIEVEAPEYLDLQRQGLLLPAEEPVGALSSPALAPEPGPVPSKPEKKSARSS